MLSFFHGQIVENFPSLIRNRHLQIAIIASKMPFAIMANELILLKLKLIKKTVL